MTFTKSKYAVSKYKISTIYSMLSIEPISPAYIQPPDIKPIIAVMFTTSTSHSKELSKFFVDNLPIITTTSTGSK